MIAATLASSLLGNALEGKGPRAGEWQLELEKNLSEPARAFNAASTFN